MVISDTREDLQVLKKATGRAIKYSEAHARNSAASGHINILREHGIAILAPQPMIDVYAELAKPDTTGGVVIVLERPSTAEKTRYGGGYRSVVSKTKTLRRVAELISSSTNGQLEIRDVTLLDAFPLQPRDDFDDGDPKKTSRLLDRLLAAKKPDVVLSCFRAGKHEGLIRLLQHPGVGRQSNNKYLPLETRSVRHTFNKIDAFHPSFAFHHENENSFAQLLELQFAKAFAECYGTWREESWMGELRQRARACRAELDGESLNDSAPAAALHGQQVQLMMAAKTWDNQMANSSEVSLSARMSQLRLGTANDQPGHITICDGAYGFEIAESDWQNAEQLQSV